MLLIQDWMLLTNLIEKAMEQARLQNAPRPVVNAMRQTKARVDQCKIKPPDALQVAFQERFHRNDIRALLSCVQIARDARQKRAEDAGEDVPESVTRGFEQLGRKLQRYTDEMDAATEMRAWFDDGIEAPRIIAVKR